VALTLTNSNSVSIWLGNGDGSFYLLSNSEQADNGPIGIAIGDLDDDGIPDLAVANNSSKTLSVIHGHGDGTFGPKSSFMTKIGTKAVVLGNLNSDNRKDVIIIASSGYISVFLNDGFGGFAPRQDTFISGGNDGSLADVNGDGKADLIVANSNGATQTATVLLGRGDGTFQPRADYAVSSIVYSVSIIDANADGNLDIVTIGNGGHFTIWYGLGNGTFGNRKDYVTDDGGNGIECRDLDGNGKPEVIISASSGVAVSYNRGDGTYGDDFCSSAASNSYPVSVDVGDLNRDSMLDLVIGRGTDTAATVLLGQENATFGPPSLVTTGSLPVGIVVRDFNHDGNLDFASANQGSNNVSVLLGLGNGNFNVKTDYQVGSGPKYLSAGDLNLDGNCDLVTVNGGSASISILLGNVNGSFQSHMVYSVGNLPNCVMIGDINEDFFPDLLVGTSTSPVSIAALLGTGSGTFNAPYNLYWGWPVLGIDLADINNDGHVDIIMANGAGSGGIAHGNGFGGFGTRIPIGTTLGSTLRVMVRDCDADGVVDVAFIANLDCQVGILKGDGAGGFGSEVDYGVGRNPNGMAVADVNQDGKPDVVTANSLSKDVSVLLNIGSPPVSFVPPPPMEAANIQIRAWPSPFQASTHIEYVLARPSQIQASIQDVTGRLIRIVETGLSLPGAHAFLWDGRNGHGEQVGPGIYFFVLGVEGQRSTCQKLVLVR
jgi:hypothetical protein